MKKLFIITALLIPALLIGQDIKKIPRGALNNSRATSRINSTIVQSNLNVDSLAAQAIDFHTGDLYVSDDAIIGDSLAVGGHIAQVLTHSTNAYVDLITSEWTPGAAMTSGGTNGIYSIVNPILNFQNAYGLRSRVDLRDAAAGVGFNQIHAVDGLINLSEEIYSVDDNISVFGGAIHSVGITAGDVDSTGTLNMFFGVFPSNLTENFTVETNAMKTITWPNTHVDYGFNYENSGTTQAGIYLNNHASNSPAIMVNGILMKSAASKMTYGLNMDETGITGADILCQNGAKIDNIDADTLDLTETIVKVTGTLYVTGDISSGGTTSDYAITDDQPELDDFWAKTLELNKLPAFEEIDRTNLVRYINGLEETSERLLRYIIELEARITELEK